MRQNKSKRKNSGYGSRKVSRVLRAKARQEAFAKLTQAEQQEQKARNKAQYDFEHPRS